VGRGKAEYEAEQKAVGKAEMVDDDDERPLHFPQILSAIHPETIKQAKISICDRPCQELRQAQKYHVVVYGL